MLFPTQNEDIPRPAMLVYQRVDFLKEVLQLVGVLFFFLGGTSIFFRFLVEETANRGMISVQLRLMEMNRWK